MSIVPAPEWSYPEYAQFPSRGNALHSHLLSLAAADRGLSVTSIANGLFQVQGLSGESGFFASRVASTQGFVAIELAKDKMATTAVLARCGIRTAAGRRFAGKHLAKAIAHFHSLQGPAVVKPIDGTGGKGVTVDIRTEEHFREAWAFAGGGRGNAVLVERFVRGFDHRIFVVEDKVVAAARRHPAFVIGDGVHSIEQLVELKSKARTQIPYVGAKPISLTAMMKRNLAAAGMSSETILDQGVRWELHAVANIGGGGESEDITEILHPGFAEIALSVKNCFPMLTYTGIDLLADDVTRSPDDQDWAICEVNGTPDFALHHFPVIGKGRDVAGLLLRLCLTSIESLPPVGKKTVEVTIKGKVTGVGYRNWLRATCGSWNVSGTARNEAADTVKAVLSGTPAAVDAVIKLCKSGPRKSKPKAVFASKKKISDEYDGFEVL